MDIEDIKKKVDQLNDQRQKIDNEIEQLSNIIDAATNKEIIAAIKGTTWNFTGGYSNNFEFEFDENNEASKNLDKLVCGKWWPHGRGMISDTITMTCNDGKIDIDYYNQESMQTKNPNDYAQEILTESLKFLKLHGAIINYDSIDEELEDLEKDKAKCLSKKELFIKILAE